MHSRCRGRGAGDLRPGILVDHHQPPRMPVKRTEVRPDQPVEGPVPGAGVAQRRKLFCRYVAGRLHEGLSIRRIKGAKVKSESEIFLLRWRIFRVRFLILDNLAYLCAPKQAELGCGPRGLAENRPR